MKVKYLLLVLEVHAKEASDFLCTEPMIKVISVILNSMIN